MYMYKDVYKVRHDLKHQPDEQTRTGNFRWDTNDKQSKGTVQIKCPRYSLILRQCIFLNKI